MSFRLKIYKTKGKEYASIVENIYDKKLKDSTSKTIKTFDDLVV